VNAPDELIDLVHATTPDEGMRGFEIEGRGGEMQIYTAGDPTDDEVIEAFQLLSQIDPPVLFLTACEGMPAVR